MAKDKGVPVLKRKMPPPTRFTVKDRIQIVFGAIMVPLGLAILYEMLVRGVVGPGLLIGGAFVAFGIYRLTQAWGRLRWYYSRQRTAKHG